MALVFATRWPLRGAILEEYDSANYAFALERIDVKQHWPHPPGYILFVWAARLAHLFVSDPILALSTVNVVGGMLSAALLFAIFRLGMTRGEACIACVAGLGSAQVWFQQTRPMEDSFAFACMLAATLGLGLAMLGRRAAVLPAFFLAGLVPGAKQLLALYLLPLACRTLLEWWRRDRRLAVGAVAASIAGALVWLLPLCWYTGSFLKYLEWGWGQVLWLDREALVTNAPLLADRVHAVVVIPWAVASFAWLWLAAAWGAFVVWRERKALRFLFWLLAPILLIRVLALGQWPRFSIYYLPFLLAFVVAAAIDAGRRMHALHTRIGASDRRRLAYALSAAALFLWISRQADFILPTLRSLHTGPSPVGEAIRVAAATYDPAETLVVVPSDNRVVLRQAEYYGSRAGLRVVEENEVETADLRKRKHVLSLFGKGFARTGAAWSGGGMTPLGLFSLPQPRWRDLSMWDETWDVGIAEQDGAYVRFIDWDGDVDGLLVGSSAVSRIEVLRPPEQGFLLLLQLEARGLAGRYRVNREPWQRLSVRDRAATLRVAQADVGGAGNRVRLGIRPACPQAQPDCLRVTSWTIEALR